jgi:two-component system, sensor histidine kinase LadS
MPILFARLLVALMCLCAGAAWATNSGPTSNIALIDSNPSMQVTANVDAWLDAGSTASISSVASAPGRFGPAAALARHALTDRDTLWLKLVLVRPPGSTANWTLNIPLPYLDSATLYQRDGLGGWSAQTAGDRTPQEDWSRRGLYPEFDLKLPAGQAQEVYLRIRNFKEVAVPMRIATTQVRDWQRLLEGTALGVLLGCLLAVSALTVLRYVEHKNRHDIWASVYGVLIMATVAEITGMLNLFFWPHLTDWGNYAYGVAPLIASGAALLFVRRLYALSTHYHRYSGLLRITGWGTIGSVFGYLVFDRPTADWLGTVVLVFALSVGLAAALLSWRGQSTIWRWLMLAYVPQYLCLLRLMAENLDLVPMAWDMRYWLSMAVAFSVPVLAYALSRATHDRETREVRAHRLPTQDALTGLLTEEAFLTHLDQALERSIGNREPIALVMVKVINHEHIRQSLGDTVAEQCLLRAVVKLHRILRDVDPAGRVDTDHFALLLEGVSTREVLTERMVQLIASGLIPLPGLTPQVTLQFQASCVLLHENPLPLESALEQLKEVLREMSPKTRRPIRFLEAVPTEVAALQAEADPQ